MNYLYFGLIIFVLNLPFGYWRANTVKFSSQWVLAIHIPVLIIIVIRLFSHMGFSVFSLLISFLTFFFGQFSGGKLHFFFPENREGASSCLVMDTFRLFLHPKD